MTTEGKEASDAIKGIIAGWYARSAELEATMYAKRPITQSEADRAMDILKCFRAWSEETTKGPCPIQSDDTEWMRRLCALCEWIAVLETDRDKGRRKKKV